MINYIICAVLLIIGIMCIRSVIKHLKGEGGCCGKSGGECHCHDKEEN